MTELTDADKRNINTIQQNVPREAVERFRKALAEQECYVRELRSLHKIPATGDALIPRLLQNHPALTDEQRSELTRRNDEHSGSIVGLGNEAEQAAKRLGIEDKVAGDPPMNLSARATVNITSAVGSVGCMEISRARPRAPSMPV